MPQQRIVRFKQPPVTTLTLLDSELDDVIECVANAADRAESGSYDMAGTPKAKAIGGKASLCSREPPGKCKRSPRPWVMAIEGDRAIASLGDDLTLVPRWKTGDRRVMDGG
jgi:hypothetical protein